jgi:DNA ligase-1
MQRQSYEKISSITSQHTPHDGWRKIKLMLFDLPEQNGTFSQRVSAMRELVAAIDSDYLSMIPQFRVLDPQQLMQRLNQVVDDGGEGLMLHHQAAYYVNGRTDALLKLKLYQDAEATVIAYKPGKGKFSGMLGSIRVRDEQGREFYIGSGFTHEQRKQPPALHSRVSYRYQGRTRHGLPRFPVFLRVRNEK